MEDFHEPRLAHACHGIALDAIHGDVGHIDIQERVGRQALVLDDTDEVSGDACRGVPDRLGEGVERNRHAGNAEDGTFGCSGDRPRVDDADAGIGSEVDSADHEVGFLLEQAADGQLDAIGGGSAHAVAEEGAIPGDLAGLDGIGEGDGVADRATFGVGRDHLNFAKILHRIIERQDARRVNAIVVAEENTHGHHDA